jgi:hypothetical protein
MEEIGYALVLLSRARKKKYATRNEFLNSQYPMFLKPAARKNTKQH